MKTFCFIFVWIKIKLFLEKWIKIKIQYIFRDKNLFKP